MVGYSMRAVQALILFLTAGFMLSIMADYCKLTVIHGGETLVFEVERGANLRRSLLDAGISPYTALTRITNCGGRGLCATCGVWIDEGEPAPQHWHDKLAKRFAYPRLSCQISVDEDMTVHILQDKVIWGQRDPKRS